MDTEKDNIDHKGIYIVICGGGMDGVHIFLNILGQEADRHVKRGKKSLENAPSF